MAQKPSVTRSDLHGHPAGRWQLFPYLRLCDHRHPIIFTTAYDQYAIKAFEVNSVDYLLKPIDIEQVRKALDKFNRRNPALQRPADPFTWGNETIKRILVPCKDRILPIKTEQIAYFYSTGGSGELMTFAEQRHPLGKSLDTLILKLDPTLFFRVNRQFILSKEAIESITIWFDNRLRINLIVPTPEPIYIAKNRAAEFKQWLANH
ncbi:MAG: LytR/AlgR family response regulator transcription factor [Parabacteroides sp.]